VRLARELAERAGELPADERLRLRNALDLAGLPGTALATEGQRVDVLAEVDARMAELFGRHPGPPSEPEAVS
jgi:hypothetical protein